MLKVTAQIIFFLVVITTALQAQDDLRKQYDYAESIYKSENYWDAITEYKRLQFFDTQNLYDFVCNYKIAECYKAGGKYEDAIRYYTLAGMKTESDTNKYQIQIQIARVNILRKSTERALELLNKLYDDRTLPVDQKEIDYWRGWAYMFSNQWEKARAEFAKLNNAAELQMLCGQVIHDKYSVTIAKVISYILPGSGEFYTGHYLTGLMSLGWNAACGYFTINAFAANRAFDGIVIGDLLWLRFYRGSIQNAGKYAEEKNLEIANNKLLYIQNNYRGIKP